MTQLTNQSIALNRLVLHPDNVRVGEQYDDAMVEAVAANIQSVGLLARLIVQDLGEEKAGVLDGGLRLAALGESVRSSVYD